MATSLMNDTTYAFTIASELTKVAHTLFIHTDNTTQEGREALILNEADITDITHANETRNTP